MVYLLGENFGPAGTVVSVVYSAKDYAGLSYTADCFVAVPHFNVTCRTIPGVGSSLFWQLVVGGQFSVGGLTSYCIPQLTGVSAVVSAYLDASSACQFPNINASFVIAGAGGIASLPVAVFDTQGRSMVQLDGSNFGNSILDISVDMIQVLLLLSFVISLLL